MITLVPMLRVFPKSAFPFPTVFYTRYVNKPNSKGISRMAFSLTDDIGFEKGGGNQMDSIIVILIKPTQYFVSAMFTIITWFVKNKLAWTIGGGWMKNPGRY